MKSGRLEGKHAIITGASSGIGKEIALGFAKEGANLAITFNSNKEEVMNIVEQVKKFGRKCLVKKCDFRSPEDISKLSDYVFTEFNQVDIAINSAGIAEYSQFLKVTHKDLEKMMHINAIGPFMWCQEICKKMIFAETEGSIIFVSSIRASRPKPLQTHYSSSKAAITAFCKSAAAEMAQYGIRINSLSPGGTYTKLTNRIKKYDQLEWKKRIEKIPLQRYGLPSDHLNAAIFLASNESSWITGIDLIIDGGESIIC